MATHDYVIANQSGAAFRTDLNNALAAIVSNNSNSSQPGTRYAYQWWADTSAGVMKIRNSANDGWIELFQLDGTLTLEDGSNSAPALAFRDDLDTGIFSDAANEFNVATGGVERFSCSNSAFVVNQTGADVDFRIEGSSAVNLLYVDAGNNKVGINTNVPEGLLHVFSGSAGTLTAATDADELVLEASANVGLSLLTANDSLARIKFGDPDASGVGAIVYNHQNDKLQINTASGTRFLIGSDMVSARQDFGIARTAGGYTFRETNEGSERAGILSNSSNELIFKIGTESEKMRIDSSGRTMIGNTFGSSAHSAADDLIIGATSGSNGMTILTGSATGNIFFNNGSANNGTIQYIHSTSPQEMRFNSAGQYTFDVGGTEKVRLRSDGKLLIGQTSVSSTEASGILCASAAISGGGQGVITANDTSSNDFGCGVVINKNSSTTSSSARFMQFYANNFGQPMGGIVGNGTENAQLATLSDERYKKNIKPLSGILEKVNKLKTISFDWKHKNESVKAGFIAQNVQEIFPEYVVDNIGNDESNKKMGTTGGMSAGYIAILTAAIQELSAKVAALEAA
jgi:hypothetical protein